ncbi:MAG TPA: hypothetical protein VIX19_15525 [Terriglobales bacterium]
MRTASVSVIAFLIQSASWAQTGGAPTGLTQAPTPYGNGQQPLLTYTGAAASSDVLLLSVNTVTSYDDNILGTTQPTMADGILGLGPRLTILQQHPHLAIAIDYEPYFQLYQHLTQYNRVNQALDGDVTYTVGPRLSLRLRDAFSDQTGTYQTESNQAFVPGLGSPTTLNNTIYTPFAAQRSNNARLDVTYNSSSRTSVSFFGGYGQTTYTDQQPGVSGLLDTLGFTGGLQYTYRLSAHTSLGMVYTYQVFQYEGNVPVGSPSRFLTNTAALSLAWRASPSFSLQVFGGPQYLPAQNQFARTSSESAPAGSGSPALWSWTAGGTVTKQSEKTTLHLSVGRAVTNGGGLLTMATNAYVDFGVSRRIIRRWSVTCDLNGAYSKGLSPGYIGSTIESLNGTVGLEHPLSEHLNTRLTYTLTRQNATGAVPFGADLNHSVVSLAVFYRFRKIPLGH